MNSDTRKVSTQRMQAKVDLTLGTRTSQLYLLANALANKLPEFYTIKGAGQGDHATNHFMRELRCMASSVLGKDCSEKRVCKETQHAFDFYIPEEKTAIEIALSLRNPTSEYERDIFKCLIAMDSGLEIETLLFISKPGALTRHEAPGSRRIRKLVQKKFGLTVEILELVPSADIEELIQSKLCLPIT